jgi:hypothetical protein
MLLANLQRWLRGDAAHHAQTLLANLQRPNLYANSELTLCAPS